MIEGGTLTQNPPRNRESGEQYRNSKVSEEDELQLVRRLDWRFLLPDPSLLRVAYFGPEDPTLISALDHFAQDLLIVQPDFDLEPESFDLVVCKAGASDLARAFSGLKSGGCIYWEIERRRPAPVDGRKGSAKSLPNSQKVNGNWKDLMRFLEELGFRNFQVHWHRPDFESCLDIVPLNENLALDYFFSKDSADFKGKAKTALGRLLTRTGLLNLWVPCVSILAQKPEAFH